MQYDIYDAAMELAGKLGGVSEELLYEIRMKLEVAYEEGRKAKELEIKSRPVIKMKMTSLAINGEDTETGQRYEIGNA